MKRSRGDGFRFEIFIVFPNELTISLFVTNVVDNKKKVKSFLILFRLILKADAVQKFSIIYTILCITFIIKMKNIII